jgi:hypothetical protein
VISRSRHRQETPADSRPHAESAICGADRKPGDHPGRGGTGDRRREGNDRLGPGLRHESVLDCTSDGVAEQSGDLFLNSEVEPWIDVNPTNTDNVVGIWQQDRRSNGGARGLVTGVGHDGGTNWQEVIIPEITLCSGGDYDRATDPWVSFGPDGTLHQLALSFNDIAPPFEPRDFDHALLASRSDDGGLTWSEPVEVIRDLDANVFNDKQSITADPTDADLVYAVWDRLVFPASERASVISGFVTAAFRGPAWFARSTDGGVTWEAAKQIYDPGQNDQTIGNQMVVLPDGTLVDVFNEIRNDNRGAATREITSPCSSPPTRALAGPSAFLSTASARFSSPTRKPVTRSGPVTSSRKSPSTRPAVPSTSCGRTPVSAADGSTASRSRSRSTED